MRPIKKHELQRSRLCGVIVLNFYFDDPCSNPVEDNSFYLVKMFEKNDNNSLKRPEMDHYLEH